MSDEATITLEQALRHLGLAVLAEIENDARAAAWFRLRYAAFLPSAQEDFAGMVTARWLQEFVRDRLAHKKRRAVRITGGPVVIEPLGTVQGGTLNMVTLESGTQGRRHLGFVDAESIEVTPDAPPTAESTNPALATGEIQQRTDGSFDVVYANPAGGGLTDPNDPASFPVVTVRSGDALPLAETVQVTAGPVAAVTGGDVTIEPLGTPAP